MSTKPKKFGLIDIGFYSDHIENYTKVFSVDGVRVFFLERYAKNKQHYDHSIFEWLGLDPDAVNMDRAIKSKEDSNANFRIVYEDGVLAFKNGIEQVRHLRATDGRYKKMLEIDPPIVEPDDIDFLNQVYAPELGRMRSLYPEAAEIWNTSPTLADY